MLAILVFIPTALAYAMTPYADFFTARAGYIDEFLNFVDYSAVNALLPKS